MKDAALLTPDAMSQLLEQVRLIPALVARVQKLEAVHSPSATKVKNDSGEEIPCLWVHASNGCG